MSREIKKMTTLGPTRRVAVQAAALAISVLISGCGGSEPAAPGSQGQDAPIAVELRPAALVTQSVVAQATGAVEPITRAMPGTKILGRIARVPVREGDRVRKGELLALLENADLEAAVEQARAAVAMAEAQRENARAMHERIVELHARGSVTDKNLEDAVAGFRVAEAGVLQAGAQLNAAEVMLGYGRVVSPITGQVVERRVEAGDMASPGMPMFVIEDVSTVKLIVQVPEAAVVGIAEGDAARVLVDVVGDERDAVVHRVLPSADRMSRTFDVDLRLDNAAGRLRSGMFARASFVQGEREVLAVERGALVRRGQLEGVFVVEADLARLRWLRLGAPVAGERVEVLSGLEPGDLYVSNPPATLADGARVSAR